jgi:hypothetical protein
MGLLHLGLCCPVPAAMASHLPRRSVRGGLHPGLPSEGLIEEEVALPMGVTIESTFDLGRAKEGDQGAGLAVDHFPVGGMVLPQLVIELFQQPVIK